MAFPKASEARKLSEVPAKMRQLGDNIRSDATIGKTELTLNMVLPGHIVEKIEDYGYAVFIDLNHNTTTINWEV